MTVNRKDLAAGLLFLAIGLFFALNAALGLRIGEAMSMGPGYFPLVLGVILCALGVGIMVAAAGKPSEALGRVPWRGVGLVLGSIVFFGFTVRGLGLAPSLFVAVLMAGRSSGLLGWAGSAVLAAVLTLFSLAVFIYGLGLPYPAIGPWLMAR